MLLFILICLIKKRFFFLKQCFIFKPCLLSLSVSSTSDKNTIFYVFIYYIN